MQSSPADGMEIWATVLSEPLADGGMSCSSTPATEQIDLAYVDYDTMAIQQLLEGPQDEHDLDRLLEEGAYNPTYMKEASLTHEAVPATTQPEKEGTCVASTVYLLDYIPQSNWRSGCGTRAPRKRRMPLSTEQMILRNHFGDMPPTSKGRTHGLRTNNEHWTLEEVTKLVDGVEKYGVGRWTRLKNEMFSVSVRTPRTGEHLKDKWRNLLKAYKLRPSPKKKGNAKRRFLLSLDKRLIKRIQKLAAVHPYPKSRRNYE